MERMDPQGSKPWQTNKRRQVLPKWPSSLTKHNKTNVRKIWRKGHNSQQNITKKKGKRWDFMEGEDAKD